MNRLALLSLFVLTPACATFKETLGFHHADTQTSRAHFDRIKSLAGEWTGQGGEGKDTSQVEVRYRVTANGSAVEETLFPGTEHEMVTVYHMDGDRLMLTHYCAAGNQPRMVARSGEAAGGNVETIRFDFAGATNLASPDNPHMHQMVMRIEGKNHLTSEWTFFKDGKPAEEARFDLTRKTSGA